MGAVTKRHPKVRKMMLLGYEALRWLNHSRHRVRKSINGIVYELDLSELIDGDIYLKGTFEANTVAAIKTLARPGHVILDVGANVGCHTFLLATLAGPSGSVIAFEPIGWAFQKLTRNLALNPEIKNVRLEKLAVSSQPASGQVVKFRASWRPFDRSNGRFTETVDVTTVDEYMKSLGSARVDFIKIDVDGFEFKVVSGARGTLLRDCPALVMEFGNYTLAAVGDSLQSLAELLMGMGYLIFHETNHRPFSTWQEITASICGNETINVVCIHRDDIRLRKWVDSFRLATPEYDPELLKQYSR
jgi:FkbM family methyltransferase